MAFLFSFCYRRTGARVYRNSVELVDDWNMLNTKEGERVFLVVRKREILMWCRENVILVELVGGQVQGS